MRMCGENVGSFEKTLAVMVRDFRETPARWISLAYNNNAPAGPVKFLQKSPAGYFPLNPDWLTGIHFMAYEIIPISYIIYQSAVVHHPLKIPFITGVLLVTAQVKFLKKFCSLSSRTSKHLEPSVACSSR